MLALPPALASLGARDQFVAWYAWPSDRDGKLDKLPLDWRTGELCDAQNPDNWTNFTTVSLLYKGFDRGHGSGVGFVFTEADDFWFLDADGCWNGHEWDALACVLTQRLAGAACEVSMSGRGLHWFGRYTRRPQHSTKNTALGLELYTAKRFVALTGNGAQGDAGLDCTAALEAIVAEYFPPVAAAGPAQGWTSEPVPEWSGPADDDELIRRATAGSTRSAAAVFAADAVTFADLWEARPEPLGRKWPDGGSRPYDASHADMALANRLAFWTGKNCDRMERLMRRSALARGKWDDHRTYLADTILKACGHVQRVASNPTPQPPPVSRAAGGRDPNAEYMMPPQQLDHFAGCFFLSDQAKVFSLPRNEIMGESSFNVVYGGHMFVLDPAGQKITDSAWKAFTLSRVLAAPVVHGLCFRPELEPGVTVTVGGRQLVNSYVPYACPEADGDPSPFLAFLAKLLPDDGDRATFLAYLAAMKQYPGHKFQWWPVLQGMQGNGKTLIISLMTHVCGEHYTHLPNAHAMARTGLQFNSWIERKLFIGIEEIALTNKRDFLDEFKPIVTNLRIHSEGKGKDQVTADNRANGILCTNHKDGVPVDVDDRRYAIFYTAQQSGEDLIRDGMSGGYFPDLYDWFHGRGAYVGQPSGAAVVARYLAAYAIPAALNPAGALDRAPRTSSTAAAVTLSLGRAEQEVLEAIEQGRSGFAGGWVSSHALDELLDRIRAPVPRSRRRALMQALGYDWHPALPAGRVQELVMPDNAKPKLYLKAGHLGFNLTDPRDVGKAYTRAQEPGAVTEAARAFAAK